MKKVHFLLLLVVFLTGCSNDYDDRLKISVNSWIGYTPIFYAYDKGWLESYNIEVLNLVSLAESMYLYDSGNSDALTGTQYEFKQLKKDHPGLTALMLFDRSNGGDMLLSNLSIDELKQTDQIIDIYLEIDSVNSELIRDFLNYYKLSKKQIRYINKDQAVLAKMNYVAAQKPVLIVTYVPYNISLQKKGFKIISSTRELNVITVIDALFATQKVINHHQKQFKQLKKDVDRAISVLKNDPHEYYKHIKHYLQDITYQEFLTSLEEIKWLNDLSAEEIKKELPSVDIPLNGLIDAES